MLRLVERPGHQALVRLPAVTRAVVSWNTGAPAGGIALVAHRAGGSVSGELLYVRWNPLERRSLGGADEVTRIAIDVVRSDVPLVALGVAATVPLDAVFVAAPPAGSAAPIAAPARAGPLPVPVLGQYLSAYPHERGWCSPASLAMLLRFWDRPAEVADVAAAVRDEAYDGTGNWTFNMAYAATRGLVATVAYLRGLDHAAAFTAAGIPVALSIGWNPGELTGAALERSDGHLVVLCGVDGNRAVVNDPAHGATVRYQRAELDAVFREHGGVAYLIAPPERTADLVALANGDLRALRAVSG